MTQSWEMTETLAHRYSSDSTQWELSCEHPHDLVLMIFIIFSILVHWTKVISASDRLIVCWQLLFGPMIHLKITWELSIHWKTYLKGSCILINISPWNMSCKFIFQEISLKYSGCFERYRRYGIPIFNPFASGMQYWAKPSILYN